MLSLSHTPVAVGSTTGGTHRLHVISADHIVGFTGSDLITNITNISGLTVKNRKILCGRSAEGITRLCDGAADPQAPQTVHGSAAVNCRLRALCGGAERIASLVWKHILSHRDKVEIIPPPSSVCFFHDKSF